MNLKYLLLVCLYPFLNTEILDNASKDILFLNIATPRKHFPQTQALAYSYKDSSTRKKRQHRMFNCKILLIMS